MTIIIVHHRLVKFSQLTKKAVEMKKIMQNSDCSAVLL